MGHHFVSGTLTALLGSLLLSSCSPNAGAPQPLTVQVQAPDSYRSEAVAGTTVTLRSADGEQTQIADANGIVRFETLTPGTYEIQAQRDLTADESARVTGHGTAHRLEGGIAQLRIPTTSVTVDLRGPRVGNLVVRELYYAGSPGVGGNHYFSDQFLEIYNNSTQSIALDGLCIGDAHGPAGEINPGTRPTPFANDTGHVVLDSVWRIPGSGNDHVLPPGQSVLIAHDGNNHQPFSPLDLSDAEWETYNQRDDGRDVDSPTSANLERVVFNGGFDWLLPVFGGSVVLFRVENIDALERVPVAGLPGMRVRVPVEAVIDGVDTLMDANSARFKRVPSSIDAGFTYVSGTYTGESVRRRIALRINDRVVYQDTNDSAQDFEVAPTPTPRSR